MTPIVFIPLTRGKVAVIDLDDFERVRRHSWCAQSPGRGKFYAVSRIDYQLTLLHRFVLNAPEGTLVDHKNRQPLDCRKDNLRFCTCSENIANQAKRSGLSSRFKGVCRVRINKTNPWMAYVGGCGPGPIKRKHLGYFHQEEDAARAHDRAAKEMFGEFAVLNFP